MTQRAELAIDAADRQLDLVAQMHVGLDTLATRACNLNECDIANLDRTITQKLSIRLKTVTDALRVIEAVNTEHDRPRITEALANIPCALLHSRIESKLLKAAGVNRNRERLCDNATGRLPINRHLDGGILCRMIRQPTNRRRKVGRI